MKKFFIMAVAAITALSSCTSEFIDNGGAQTKVFKARMENVGSRVTLNGNTPAWEIGDAIDINGKTFTVASIEDGVAELEGPAEEVSAPYTAKYPAAPIAEETYGNFNMPMMAQSSTHELNFTNTAGVLAIYIDKDLVGDVKGINVNSGNQAVASVTYTSPVSESGVHYVAVAPGTYPNGLQIFVNVGGTPVKYRGMYTTVQGGIAIERNNMYSINFEESDGRWDDGSVWNMKKWINATSIVVETNKAKPTTAGVNNLNSKGSVWEVLDGNVLRIQTSADKIILDKLRACDLFSGKVTITSISGLNNFDYSECIYGLDAMFMGCEALTSIDLSSFSTVDIKGSLSSMFAGCSSLTYLDLSSFNIENVSDVSGMFSNCKKLQTLLLNNSFNITGKNVDDMFNGCGGYNGNICIIKGVTDANAKASLMNGTSWNEYCVAFE